MSTDRRLDKVNVVHIHAIEYYSAVRNEILAFATTWLALEGIMLSEITQRERQTLYDLTYMWNHGL